MDSIKLLTHSLKRLALFANVSEDSEALARRGEGG